MDIQEKEWGSFVEYLKTKGVIKIGRNALGVITNLVREGGCTLGYNDLELMWETWRDAKAQAVPEWISVEDKLPKRNIKVLLNVVARRHGKPLSCIGFYSIEPDDEPCFVLDDNFTVLKGVTHWMLLPQPPKAQEPTND